MRFHQHHEQARSKIRQSGMSLKSFQRIIQNQHKGGGLQTDWLESLWPNDSEVRTYAEQYIKRYDYLTPMIERKQKELEEAA